MFYSLNWFQCTGHSRPRPYTRVVKVRSQELVEWVLLSKPKLMVTSVNDRHTEVRHIKGRDLKPKESTFYAYLSGGSAPVKLSQLNLRSMTPRFLYSGWEFRVSQSNTNPLTLYVSRYPWVPLLGRTQAPGPFGRLPLLLT